MPEEATTEETNEIKSENEEKESNGLEGSVADAQNLVSDISGWSSIINLAVMSFGWSEMGRALSRTICTIVPSVGQFADQFGGGKFKLWTKPLTLSLIDIAQMVIWILITAVWVIIILAIIALIAAAVICLSSSFGAAACVYEYISS